MTSPIIIIAIGVLFLAGLLLDNVGRHMHVPRVTMLILLGAVAGPPVLDWLPSGINGSNELYAPTALTMVAFLLGGTLNPETLRERGREIMIISLSVVIISVVVVSGGLMLFGVPAALALLLGGLSAATDPAATRDVVVQTGSKGRFAANLLGIVAIDDAWGLLVFSLVLTLAAIVTGGAGGESLMHGVREVGGAILLGGAIGLPAAYLTGRVKPGEPTLIEALGVVFLCAGLAMWLNLSFLLTGMTCGAVIVNLARHHDRPFHEIERIEWPFMLLFFVMAGASLELEALEEVAAIVTGYIVLRGLGRIAGGWTGGRLSGLSGTQGRWTGFALMPQAGVAIGMALVAAERFPGLAEPLLAITIASTIAFELAGPLMTQFALSRSVRLEMNGQPETPLS